MTELFDKFRTNCPVDSGDVINVILDGTAHENISDSIKINMKENVIIVHPDILISGTTVSNGLGCLRRAVLSERFKVKANNKLGSLEDNSLFLCTLIEIFLTLCLVM